eukprot:CAMPEP_0194327112 /NCGR_PEP_ID=MMETSP0171-20130528/39681_1 /TAXON_ID=218684 /ORGANISM="Corethron pennatum, Strain L29A3" /LENGTH=86 /DNA_ID=CAMNT_0039086949 /DNA_START=45 /DNA_END=305 /DNA_ORIENTATION=+
MAMRLAFAVLAYVPFEILSKTTLLFCVIMFVLDPVPPLTRLFSLALCALLFGLVRVERVWKEGQVNNNDSVVVTGGHDEGAGEKND